MKTNCGMHLQIGDEVLVDGLLRGTIIRADAKADPMWLSGASPNFYIESKDGKEQVKPKRVAVYARVSTDDQSVDLQLKAGMAA